jgi:hypothetical protein
MFGQHPGYFKAVFLKKTQIIIVSIYEYTHQGQIQDLWLGGGRE